MKKLQLGSKNSENKTTEGTKDDDDTVDSWENLEEEVRIRIEKLFYKVKLIYGLTDLCFEKVDITCLLRKKICRNLYHLNFFVQNYLAEPMF